MLPMRLPLPSVNQTRPSAATDDGRRAAALMGQGEEMHLAIRHQPGLVWRQPALLVRVGRRRAGRVRHAPVSAAPVSGTDAGGRARHAIAFILILAWQILATGLQLLAQTGSVSFRTLAGMGRNEVTERQGSLQVARGRRSAPAAPCASRVAACSF